jgi:hypothetical protein
VSQRSNDYSAPTVTCYSIKCAPERAEVRHARSGAPDSLQCMSGVPPDIQAGPAVRAYSIKCAPKRAEVRHARSGAPDSLQCMSGVPPDIQAGPTVRAPMVGTQRPGDVAGAPDTVRCAPDCSVHHATDSPTKRLVWWLGL